MTLRVRLLIALMLVAGACSVRYALGFPASTWLRFSVYLVAVLLTSGLKVAMPKGEGTLSVNFPFILLGIVQLSPSQAITLAALSVFAQCRIRVMKPFTLVQIAFNVSNTVTATMLAWLVFTTTARAHVELAPALALAATTYFFANTIPVATVIGWSKSENPILLWRREFPWYLPFYLVGAVLAAAAHLISLRLGWTTSLLLIPFIYTIYRAYRSQMGAVQDRQRHLEETEALHVRTIEGLAMAIEAKDQNTHDHLLRVRVYVAEIGRSLRLDALEMEALMTAAFLHDIGKLAVPEHIVNKPGKLTPEEFEKMKIHPVVGADILERVRFPYPVVPIVRSHHEAWDGSGYPDGLKGEDIPIGARILTVVDCFDALASDRPYRKALPLTQAMAMVKKNAGTQFDPRVVEVLEQRYVELEERARKQGESLIPLNTDISVSRGAAPAAGFQRNNEKLESGSGADARSSDHSWHSTHMGTQFDSLNLIAAASQEAQAIFEMSQMLGSSLSPNETISVMSSRLRGLMSFECFALYLRSGNLLSIQYVDGSGARMFSDTRIQLAEGLSGWVAQSGRPILNGNPEVEPNYEGCGEVSTSLKSALSLPLFDLEGEVFGVLTIYSAGTDAFSRDHLRILQAIESKFSLSLQNALRFRSAEKEASVDFVTQLPNVRQFFLGMEEELEKARLSKTGLCVLVCDLNSFKAVNDLQGHLAGNILLRSVADGFRECCRPSDTVARMGGDEFVFLLPGLEEALCSSYLRRVEETVRMACARLKMEVEVSTSIGAAFYPEDGNTAEELLAVADRRMYSHKRTFYRVTGMTAQVKRSVEVAAVA